MAEAAWKSTMNVSLITAYVRPGLLFVEFALVSAGPRGAAPPAAAAAAAVRRRTAQVVIGLGRARP